MKSLSAPVLAALDGGHVAVAQLVLMAFPSADLALNTSNWTLSYGGKTYLGAYGLGAIAPVTDKPGEVQGITFTLNGGDAARISMALDSADEVQGTVVTVRSAIIETSTYTILDAPLEWTGKLDTMSISEDGETATVVASAESAAVDLLRGNAATYSDADQRAAYPGDLAFAYVIDQADKPIVWPSREFFLRK